MSGGSAKVWTRRRGCDVDRTVKRILNFPRAVLSALTCGDRDIALPVLLSISLGLCLYQLNWGLPNGNFSWAADALGPLSVLSIARRSLSTFNSGWFWYKYPFGFPLLLLIAYAPYLAFLVVTGQLSNPSSTYPYGFADAEQALFTMAMLGRLVNVALIVGTVALVYGLARRFGDRNSACFAGWFAATAYPLIFYAHTTNQDAAYLFWLTLTLWATVVAIDSDDRWPYVTLGIGAAMAMATKEQGIGLLAALAVVILVGRFRRQPDDRPLLGRLGGAVWNRQIGAALAATLLATLVGNNALVNPMGIVNRILDLTGHPIPGISSRLTPLKFALFKGAAKEIWYLRQLFDVTVSTFGLPLFLFGCIGLVGLATLNRRAVFCLVWPMLTYYYVSLRTHDLLALRYALPLVPILSVGAGWLASALVRRARILGAVAVGVLLVLSLAQGMELLYLLRTDSRYQAESWLQANASPGSRIEFYQKPVYVPRLSGFDGRAVPLAERTPEGLGSRQPQFIVLSSAGRKSITHYWNPAWEEGKLLLEQPAARAMLDSIEDGQAGYEVVATFQQQPRLLRNRITSLCPEITIYRRIGR